MRLIKNHIIKDLSIYLLAFKIYFVTDGGTSTSTRTSHYEVFVCFQFQSKDEIQFTFFASLTGMFLEDARAYTLGEWVGMSRRKPNTHIKVPSFARFRFQNIMHVPCNLSSL